MCVVACPAVFFSGFAPKPHSYTNAAAFSVDSSVSAAGSYIGACQRGGSA